MTVCPRCASVQLEQKFTKGSVREGTKVEVDVCPKCHGVWFDANELDDLVKDLAKLGKPELTSAAGDLLCPRCKERLSPGNYPGTIVEIDLCTKCDGIWLDPGEFKRIKAGANRLIACCDCGQRYSVPKSRAGTSIECKKCGQSLSVTEDGVAAELPTILDEFASTESSAARRLPPRKKYKQNATKPSGMNFAGIASNVIGGLFNLLPFRRLITCPTCDGTGKMQGLKVQRDCLTCVGELKVCSECTQPRKFCLCSSNYDNQDGFGGYHNPNDAHRIYNF